MKDGLYKSVINDIELHEFVTVRMLYCQKHHSPNCGECSKLVACATDIVRKGIVELKPLFQIHFPETIYSSKKAPRSITCCHCYIAAERARVTKTLRDTAHSKC